MKPVLMSSENPNGVKLQELLTQLVAEIHQKNLKIVHDTSPAARTVVKNNAEIINLLLKARELQFNSEETLDKIGPNQGPLGAPRIGNPK